MGEVTIINGRPRHSQSQGLIEKGNHLVEMQLQAFKCEHKDQAMYLGLTGCPVFNVSTQLIL